ncbi:hypothetical protein C9J60_20200 [Streptomyces sp. A244]|uniref:hypothetical protein n=1 Tax=Streptomyces sp. A244 TaxID=2137016 RepID=UPI000D1A5433|nr:hypothetical protein [Streptomyces sp. A244]PTH86558.1 hypothetical protein C9J60_20200 [Streptomyces sp. A244]
MGSRGPRAAGEEAIARLLRSNTPGKPSLAAAYAAGYLALWHAQQEGNVPFWYQEIDPLDTLFLGTVFPRTFRDEFEFANTRDAWLRLLRGTVHGKGIQCFVREAVSASEELGLPVDDVELMLALAGRLEGAGLDQRRLPRRLLPEAALQDCRAAVGPSLDLRLPDPPKDAEERVRQFWEDAEEEWADDTPRAVLRDGLRRFREAGLPAEQESGLLLPALYARLMTKPGELVEDMGEHAWAWAVALDETSALIPVLDILLVAPELEKSVADTLGHLFAVPAFTEPFPSDALLWTSSPGLALPRLAFELGIPEVSTLEGTITADLLDWTGMHARMRLSAAARGITAVDDPDPDPTDSSDDGTRKNPDDSWTERREAVREAVQQKIRKKAGGKVAPRRRSGRPIERIWNADGSSSLYISTETPQGQELMDGLEGQLQAFREKFGREPEPDDPLFFDPDADEPTRLTKEYFDDMLLRMAERAIEVGVDPAFLHAWREVGYVVTEETKSGFTAAEVIAFDRALARHREAGA